MNQKITDLDSFKVMYGSLGDEIKELVKQNEQTMESLTTSLAVHMQMADEKLG